MRLICPNCGAQYEVPDGVVPQEGRDVQCSNCGNTWFQAHPDNDQALKDELHPPQIEEPEQTDWSDPMDDDLEIENDDSAPAVSETAQTPDKSDWDTPDTDEDEWQGFDESDPVEKQDNANEDDHIDELEAETDHQSTPAEDDQADDQDDDDDFDLDDGPDSVPPPEPKARALDPSIADILKQEAEHEAQARAADTSLESQPDLGLDDTGIDVDQRTKEANERMARLRGDAPLEGAIAATVASASRRDLLPDIEEINSTLRSTSDRKSGIVEDSYDEDYEEPRTSGKFRRGFWLIVLTALVLMMIYVFATPIKMAFPVLDGVMTSYVAMVDKLRVWFDGRLQAMLQWLDTKASTSGE